MFCNINAQNSFPSMFCQSLDYSILPIVNMSKEVWTRCVMWMKDIN